MMYNNYPDDYVVINAKWVEWDNDEQRWCFMTEDAFEKAQSLADYTKQVRKEVCDKIRKWHDEECESLDLDSDFDVGYSGALSNLWGILDQIEGKPKD